MPQQRQSRHATRFTASGGAAPFVFGLGYSALALATRLRAKGWSVVGTCRSEDRQRALAEKGIKTFLFDRGRPLDGGERRLPARRIC